MKGTISIIVPIYGVEAYLGKCLDSILGQTYRDLEIILVDDASPDKCGVICDEYAKADARIRVVHQPNMGLSGARNTGLDMATGEYVGFVDPDDYIELDYFQTLVDAMRTADVDIAISGFETFGDSHEINRCHMAVMNGDEATVELVKNRLRSYAWNKLYRAKLFKKVRFPVGFRYEDIRIMHWVFMAANKVAVLDCTGYHYNVRSTSITGETSLKNSREFIEALDQRCEDLRNTPFFGAANYGKLSCARRILYETANSGERMDEGVRFLRDALKEAFANASDTMGIGQKMATWIAIISPKAYATIRNISYKIGK